MRLLINRVSRSIIFLVILVLLAIVVWNVIVLLFPEYSRETEDAGNTLWEQLERDRPFETFMTPDFSDGVDDVRVSVRERDIDLTKLSDGEQYKDTVVLQLNYGYLSDGIWFELPCENYALRSLDLTQRDGYFASQSCHVVQIGDYVLFAYPVKSYGKSYTTPYAELTDTLGTKMVALDMYFSTADTSDAFYGYARLVENMTCYGTEKYNASVTYDFDKWYYLICKRSDLKEGYSITVTEYRTGGISHQATYTYKDLLNALDRK